MMEMLMLAVRVVTKVRRKGARVVVLIELFFSTLASCSNFLPPRNKVGALMEVSWESRDALIGLSKKMSYSILDATRLAWGEQLPRGLWRV